VLESGERGAKIQMSVYQRRIEPHGLAILTRRGFMLALRLQRNAEVIACVGEVRLQLQRLPVASLCLVVATERSGDETTVAPARRISRFDFERMIQQCGRRCVIAPLMMQDAEVMQRAGVNRVDCQRFLIQRCGLIEMTRLMGIERGGEQSVDVGRCSRFGARVTQMEMLFHENLLESAGARMLRAPAG
jgi:hypothetical protein